MRLAARIQFDIQCTEHLEGCIQLPHRVITDALAPYGQHTCSIRLYMSVQTCRIKVSSHLGGSFLPMTRSKVLEGIKYVILGKTSPGSSKHTVIQQSSLYTYPRGCSLKT
uniref:Uncharacterized protein n=1 Tax=Schistocephalus solidus TaxID=70667 RepID=A0A0X3QCF5_SCHSO